MAASRKDVDRWIATAKEKGATHVISVCDTFDYDDYPVYVMPDDDLEEIKKKYDRVNMQKINETITINKDGSSHEPGLSPNKEIEELVAQLGFASEKEFFQMVSDADISTPDKLAEFQKWKDEDGTKQGLEKLMSHERG